MRIAIITAGAAGMYCGSCLRDNGLARALHRLGEDVRLIPLYTPIRTDLPSEEGGPLFLGGINVYLQQKSSWFRAIPPILTRWMDHPRLINWLASRAVQTDASQLGDLTLSVLQAERGLLRREMQRLADWLKEDRPDVVHFSNLLIAGAARLIKNQTGAAIVVSLQGDDIFLNSLPPEIRGRVIDEISRFEAAIDAYVVNSHFYAEKMAAELHLPIEKFQVQPLAIEVDDLIPPPTAATRNSSAVKIGYLARLAPEKGLDILCQAFVQLWQREGNPPIELHVAGYLGEQHRAYAQQALEQVRQVAGAEAVHLWGEVDRGEKRAFLHQLDVLSVPSPYQEPKGLYVLESLAAGVPVVQPDHGAFPELLASTGGGLLFAAGQVDSLAETLERLIRDPQLRQQLGRQGQSRVAEHHTSQADARRLMQLYRQCSHHAPRDDPYAL